MIIYTHCLSLTVMVEQPSTEDASKLLADAVAAIQTLMTERDIKSLFMAQAFVMPAPGQAPNA